MARTNAFKETFEKINQKVIEYGKSKTFFKETKLGKEELSNLNRQIQDYRKGLFKAIYETNPDLVVHSIPICNYILIEGQYCTWNEDLLNQLPDEMLRSFANICETYSNKTL